MINLGVYHSRTMKKLFAIFFALTLCLLFACNNEKQEEKALLDEVIAIHDDVMGKEDHLMRNKMQLDTLLLPGPLNDRYSLVDKATMGAILFKLNAADEAMSAWMQNFDPELKGKSHDDKMKYFAGQKKAVMVIDSQFTAVIDSSDKYLKLLKK